MCIKLDQPSVDELVDIPIHLVVVVQDGIQAADFPNDGFMVEAAADRLRDAGRLDRRLGEEDSNDKRQSNECNEKGPTITA